MKTQITPNEILSYLQLDEYEGGLPEGNFRLALDLFLPLLNLLQYSADEATLSNLAYFLSDDQRQWLKQLADAANQVDEAAMVEAIGEERYHEQKEPRFGENNPELIDLPFWKLMVQRGWTAWRARMHFDRACREYMDYLTENPPPSFKELEMMSQEEQEAWTATGPSYSPGNAVWSFERFGRTITKLPDGREIWIAGEHEDFYDPDFHIYNDVTVMRPNLQIDIYGYPLSAFAPTDFHSATLVNESIYIIGSLGYLGTRRPGETPVYRLDTQTFQMEKMATMGDNPGWIHRHQSEYVPEKHAIRLTQGKVFLRWEGARQFRQNRKTYWLDLATGIWSSGREKAA
jgi:hypothetical protein